MSKADGEWTEHVAYVNPGGDWTRAGTIEVRAVLSDPVGTFHVRYAETWAGKCQQLEDENARLRAELDTAAQEWTNGPEIIILRADNARLRAALREAAADARNFPATTVEPDYSAGYRDGREDVARQLENAARVRDRVRRCETPDYTDGPCHCRYHDPAAHACTCATGSPEMYEGPAPDCPQHGDPAILGYDPTGERTIRGIMGPADGLQKMRLLADLMSRTVPVEDDERCYGCGEPKDNGQGHGPNQGFGGCV